MDRCLQAGVESPQQLREQIKQKGGAWDGSPTALVKDYKGQWRYGNGDVAVQQPDGSFKRQVFGLAGVFDGKTNDEVWAEVKRVEELKTPEDVDEV